MPFISIIIPVYNIEKYIIDCLDSVKNQTFNDYEVIVVNDGSEDSCEQLISDYIRQNCLENFYLVSKPNGGLSSARNAGLVVAKGEWISFVDGDDWVEPDYLSEMAECLKKYPSDLCVGGYSAYDVNTGESEKWNNYPVESGEMPEDIDKLHSFGFVWGRLYKKAIIDKYNLRFDERIRYAEDNAWQFDYNKYIKSFCCTDKVLYNYRINREGSLTQKLIHPQMKYYIAEHMKEFTECIDFVYLEKAVKNNLRFLNPVWGILTTYVTNCILDGNLELAKQEKNKELSKLIISSFTPKTKKEKIFYIFWKMPFWIFAILIKIYYGNFEKLRKSRLVRYLSSNK